MWVLVSQGKALLALLLKVEAGLPTCSLYIHPKIISTN